jgi:hypothetical protein
MKEKLDGRSVNELESREETKHLLTNEKQWSYFPRER